MFFRQTTEYMWYVCSSFDIKSLTGCAYTESWLHSGRALSAITQCQHTTAMSGIGRPQQNHQKCTFFFELASELWWLSGGKRGDYQNCSVLYCVLKLCTVISTLRWAVLTVLWIGFCLTGTISLCIDSFVFMFGFFVCLSCHTAYVLYYCNTVGWTWWDWSLILRTFLQCFDTVGWVIWPVPDMTYNVFGWDVKPYSINQSV